MVVLLGFLSLAGCTPRTGDPCDEAAQCGAGNICAICNPAGDGGTDTTGGDGTCQHPCTTDDDCAGTSGPFGETPVCGVNLCGTHYCTIRI